MKTCKDCGSRHNRKSFCSNKCKDRWHNRDNPRGIFATEFAKQSMDEEANEAGMDAIEDGWDGHKSAY